MFLPNHWVERQCNSCGVQLTQQGVGVPCNLLSMLLLLLLLLLLLPVILCHPVQVAWLNAEVIAVEMLSLVQVAAPHIKAQWAWASACNLIKMTSVRPEAFPVSAAAA